MDLKRRDCLRLPAGLATLGAGMHLANAPARAQQAVTWRFAHTTPIPGTVWHRYATEVLPQRIKEATGGQIRVQVVSGVVQPADFLAGVRDGQLQGGSLLFPYVAPTLPLWNVMSLPGLLPDDSKFPDIANRFVTPVVAEDARRRFKAEPVVLAGFPGAYFFSNGPVDSLAKMKGVKYRAHSPELAQIIQAAGGATVSMPFGELYGALQRKMVDAYTSATPAVGAAKLHEVTKFAENWPSGLGAWAYFIGTDALAKLTPELRGKVEQAMKALNTETQAATLAEVDGAVKSLKERGITFIDVPAAERAQALKIAQEKAWSAWLNNTGEPGKALLDRIRAALA